MQLFWQAVTIMVLGMGLVFLFLYVVILAVQASGALIRRFAPPEEEAGPVRAPSAEPAEVLVAVIAAALHDRPRGS